METMIIAGIVAFCLLYMRWDTFKVHRASIREDIEKSVMKSYKPKSPEERERWKQILKEIDEN